MRKDARKHNISIAKKAFAAAVAAAIVSAKVIAPVNAKPAVILADFETVKTHAFFEDRKKGYLLESMDDARAFSAENTEFDAGIPGVDGFKEVGEDFFSEHALVCARIVVGSGSVKCEPRKVAATPGGVKLVARKSNPGTGTADIATWYLFASVPKDALPDGENKVSVKVKDAKK